MFSVCAFHRIFISFTCILRVFMCIYAYARVLYPGALCKMSTLGKLQLWQTHHSHGQHSNPNQNHRHDSEASIIKHQPSSIQILILILTSSIMIIFTFYHPLHLAFFKLLQSASRSFDRRKTENATGREVLCKSKTAYHFHVLPLLQDASASFPNNLHAQRTRAIQPRNMPSPRNADVRNNSTSNHTVQQFTCSPSTPNNLPDGRKPPSDPWSQEQKPTGVKLPSTRQCSRNYCPLLLLIRSY